MTYDLIIIGGGPAAAAAGIYAARQKLNTLLITKSFGGQVARKATAIENYPGFESISGTELFQKFEKHLRLQKLEILEEEVIHVEKKDGGFSVATHKENYETKTIIVASGANPRPLNVPGEKEFMGKGISYCTVCDGPLFADKTVAVVGGGNSGFEAAIFLTNYAKKIYILEYGPRPKADENNQEEARKNPKIEIITDAATKEIKGEKFVKSLIYQDKKTSKNAEIAVDGVLIEIGNHPATAFVKDLVDFNEKNEIKIDFETCATKTEGLFAAGDVTNVKDKQIVVAAGEGVKAALSAYNYLRKTKNAFEY